MTDPSRGAPECLACGTCCFSQLATYIRVDGDDHARLGESAEALTTWDGTRCYMAMRDGHCAALVVDTARGTFTCSVYELRPRVCRELDRGSPECAGERATKWERTRGSLRVLDVDAIARTPEGDATC